MLLVTIRVELNSALINISTIYYIIITAVPFKLFKYYCCYYVILMNSSSIIFYETKAKVNNQSLKLVTTTPLLTKAAPFISQY